MPLVGSFAPSCALAAWAALGDNTPVFLERALTNGAGITLPFTLGAFDGVATPSILLCKQALISSTV